MLFRSTSICPSRWRAGRCTRRLSSVNMISGLGFCSEGLGKGSGAAFAGYEASVPVAERRFGRNRRGSFSLCGHRDVLCCRPPPGCEAWFKTGNRVPVKCCSWDFTPGPAGGFDRPLVTPLCRSGMIPPRRFEVRCRLIEWPPSLQSRCFHGLP